MKERAKKARHDAYVLANPTTSAASCVPEVSTRNAPSATKASYSRAIGVPRRPVGGRVAQYVGKHSDPFSARFAEHLIRWKAIAGSHEPVA